MRVDFHTHIYPLDLPDFALKYGNDKWPVLQPKCSCGADIMVSQMELIWMVFVKQF